MTVGEMLKWTNRLKNIVSSSTTKHRRDIRLAKIMTDLEVLYRIPALRNAQFEKENPYLMQLYRTVSAARSI